MSAERPVGQKQEVDNGKRLRILAVPVLLALNLLMAQRLKDQGFDLIRFLNGQPTTKDYTSTLPEPLKTTEDQLRMTNRFIHIKSRLEGILNEQLSLSDPSEDRLSDLPDTVRFMHERGRQHLVNGMALARIVLPLEQSATIFQSKDALTIDGDNFSLNNPYDRSLVAAILQLKFEKVIADDRIQKEEKELVERAQRLKIPVEEVKVFYPEFSKDDRPKIDSQLTVLRYLKSRNFDITLDENAWVFLPTNDLVYLGRTMKALEDNNLPTTVHVRFVRHKKGRGGGQYEGHDWPEPFTIRVTNRSRLWAIPHEAGHFLSDAAYLPDQYWADRMKPFSQTAFTEYVWPNEGRDPYESSNKEAYAEAVAKYLFDGAETRRMVVLTSDIRDDEKRKYQFVKQMFKGREFVSEGIPLIPSEIYKLGARVRINDPDQERPGILLRPVLSPDEVEVIKPDLPAVFNGDTVELLERQIMGGFFSRDGYVRTYDERTFWKVWVYSQGSLGYSVGYLDRDTMGWIEERWLGEPVQR